MRRILAVLLLAFSGCLVDLEIDEDVAVSCGPSNECPQGTVCSTSLGRCVKQSNNQAPSIVIGNIKRSLGEVSIPVTAIDPESDPVELAIDLRYLGATVSIVVSPLQLPSSPEGVSTTLSWNAAAFFGELRQLDDLVVRITPRDKFNAGPAITSSSFVFGNDPPQVTEVRVAGADIASVGGPITVAVSVRDSNDEVQLSRVELGLEGDFTTPIPIAVDEVHFSSLAPWEPTATGEPHDIVFQSGSLTTTELPLGTASVAMRIFVKDSFGTESEAGMSPVFVLDNRPRITLFPVESGSNRPLADVPITFAVTHPDLMSRLSVSFEIAASEGASGTLLANPGTLLAQKNDGSPLQVIWPAVADAMAGHAGLSTTTVQVRGEAQPTTIVAFVRELVLRAHVTDDKGRTSAAPATQKISIGDDAPVAELQPILGSPSAFVTLTFNLRDTASDLGNLESEFRLPSDAPNVWRKIAPGPGAIADLQSTPAGITHLASWDSRVALDADPAVAQGVGFSSAPNVQVRVRATENFDGKTIVGEWSSSATISEVRNKTPPRVINLELRRAQIAGGTSPIAITYGLVDDESDPVDLRFEFSFDLGASWQPCTEQRVPWSEGRHGLASAPGQAGGGGIPHSFVWDPSGVRFDAATSTAIRVTADDGESAPGPPLTVFLVQPTSQVSTAPYAPTPASFASDTPSGHGFLGARKRPMAVADLDGDSFVDVAIGESQFFWLDIALGNGSNGSHTGTFGRTPAVPGDSVNQRLYVGCFNPGGGNPGFGINPIPTCGSAYGIFPNQVVAADANDDGLIDLISLQNGYLVGGAGHDLRVFINQGSGVFFGPTNPSDGVISNYGGQDMVTADLDKDGIDDLVVINNGSLDGMQAGIYFFMGPFGGVIDPPVNQALAGNLVRVFELTDDGVEDILIRNLDNKLALAPGGVTGASSGTGVVWDGSFAAPVVISERTALSEPLRVVVDPLVSRAGLAAYDNAIESLILLAPSGPTGYVEFITPVPDVTAGAFASGDMNQDGIDDVVIAGRIRGQTGVWLLMYKRNGSDGRSVGGYVEVSRVAIGGGGLNASSMTILDLDKDGGDDVLVSTTGNELLVLMSKTRGVGASAFAANVQHALSDLTPSQIILADLDANGSADIFATDNLSGALLLNDGPDGAGWHGFSAAQSLPFAGTGNANAPSRLFDLDNDGALDLILPSFANDHLHIAYGLLDHGAASGAFAMPVPLMGTDECADALPSDFNGDGKVDLLVLSAGDLQLWMGDGARGFTSDAPFGYSNVSDVTIADFNNDRRLDFAYADHDIHFMLAGPSGDFTQAGLIHDNEQTFWQVDSADFDVDGIVDVVSGSPRFGSGADGRGTLSYSYLFGGGSYPRLPATLLDFDADGRIDALNAPQSNQPSFPDHIEVRRGPQGGRPSTFYAATVTGPDIIDGAIGFGDVDRDGRIDAAWYDSAFGTVRVMPTVRETGHSASFTLVPFESPQRGVKAFGFEPSMQADRFGLDAATPTIYLERTAPVVSGSGVFLTGVNECGVRCGTQSFSGGIAGVCQPGICAAPGPLVPLSAAWTAVGDVGWQRVHDGPQRTRLQLRPRMGAQGVALASHAGLDLSGTPPTGVVIDLPVYPEIALSRINQAAQIRVYRASRDYVRASEFPQDVLFGTSQGASVLPVVPFGLGTRNIVIEQIIWTEIPEGSFDSGSGSRFVRSFADQDSLSLQVLTDRLGTFQAFLEFP